MVTIRAAAAAAGLLIAISPLSAAQARSRVTGFPATVSGVVRDDLGKVLEGVEVLVLPPAGRSSAAVVHTMSDAYGRFLVGALAPGVYRVAAIKTGYVAALGSANTLLRSSVNLVLRPVPKPGEPGAERVQEDESWALRLPPRSVLRELKPADVLAHHDTGGAHAFAARVQDSIRGEVDHVVAMGSWRPGSTGASSSLSGNETRMRVAGTLGERGAIQVRGRRGSLDSASPATTATVSQGASDVDLDVSYDTGVDENLAMRAFYSTGDLSVDDHVGAAGAGGRQSQRSWGYDAQWRKQVDASSHVALQVGFQDANLDAGRAAGLAWAPDQGDVENRAIGAVGSYENLVGEGHLVRLDLRAQRLTLQAPSMRLGRDNGRIAMDGSTGWSLSVDSEDQWSIAGPFILTYGLALRQGFDGPDATAVAPRVGGSWTSGRMEARASVSYLAGRTSADALDDRRSPYGYDVMWKARLDPGTTLRASVSYAPSWTGDSGTQAPGNGGAPFFVTDGLASDRVVAVDLVRVAPNATVAFRLSRGRADGRLAPAYTDDLPVVTLSNRALEYGAARIGVTAPRSGSNFSLEYRSIDGRASDLAASGSESLKTISLDFAQQLVRFAGGRASCRLLVSARGALQPGSASSDADPADARRFVAEHRRVGAGVSVAF